MWQRHFAVALFITLTGCSPSGVSVAQQSIGTAYSLSEFAYAGAGRDLHVVVVGNPFGGEQADFERAVTDAMQGQHFGQPTNFTTTPGERARLIYRIVLVFDPTMVIGTARLCHPETLQLETTTGSERTSLFAAFCRERTSLTSIVGRSSRITSAQDAEFRELVGQVTHGLFPPERGRNRGGRRCPPMLDC